MFQVMKICEL